MVDSITPAIRVVQGTNNSYIAFGDNIRVEDCCKRIFSGIFLYMDTGNEIDCIVLEVAGEDIKIPCNDIVRIEKIRCK